LPEQAHEAERKRRSALSALSHKGAKAFRCPKRSISASSLPASRFFRWVGTEVSAQPATWKQNKLVFLPCKSCQQQGMAEQDRASTKSTRCNTLISGRLSIGQSPLTGFKNVHNKSS
jgi:hypothetical protein